MANDQTGIEVHDHPPVRSDAEWQKDLRQETHLLRGGVTAYCCLLSDIGRGVFNAPNGRDLFAEAAFGFLREKFEQVRFPADAGRALVAAALSYFEEGTPLGPVLDRIDALSDALVHNPPFQGA